MKLIAIIFSFVFCSLALHGQELKTITPQLICPASNINIWDRVIRKQEYIIDDCFGCIEDRGRRMEATEYIIDDIRIDPSNSIYPDCIDCGPYILGVPPYFEAGDPAFISDMVYARAYWNFTDNLIPFRNLMEAWYERPLPEFVADTAYRPASEE